MGVNMYKKYLTLTVQKGNPLPQVINWYGRLDVRKLNRKDYREIPRRLLLEMRTGMDAVYPDIIIDPVLMVSEEAMEIISLYDNRMPFIFLALFDVEKEESMSYYCPVLAEDNTGQDEVLYKVKHGNGYEIRICEELAESLLSRGAIGLKLSRKNTAG